MNKVLEQYKKFEGQHIVAHSEVAKYLNPKLIKIEEGFIEVEIVVAPKMLNSGGMLHGGITSLILDEILGATTFTLAEGLFYATSSINVHFLSAGKIGDVLTVKAEIVKKGSRLIHTEGKVYVKDKIIATATADLMVVKGTVDPSKK